MSEVSHQLKPEVSKLTIKHAAMANTWWANITITMGNRSAKTSVGHLNDQPPLRTRSEHGQCDRVDNLKLHAKHHQSSEEGTMIQ
jgi:hypothetical protein